MRFNFKNKLNNRRSTSNNVISFSKSSCRVAATPRTLGSLHFPFFHNQGSFNSCNTKAKNKVTKIHLRSFTSRKSCWVFKAAIKFAELVSSGMLETNSLVIHNLLNEKKPKTYNQFSNHAKWETEQAYKVRFFKK